MSDHQASQLMFDKMVTHLRKQGKKSLRGKTEDDAFCMYRNKDGLRCAVGGLIPKSQYRKGMEDSGSVTVLLCDYPKLSKYVPDVDLARKVQMVHDCQPVDKWEEHFAAIAFENNLILLPVSSAN